MNDTKEAKTVHDIFPEASQSYKKIMAEIEPYLSGADSKLLPSQSHWEVVISSDIKNFKETKKE